LPTSAYAAKTLHTTVYADVDGTFLFNFATYVLGNWFGSGPVYVTTNNLSGVAPDYDVSENPPEYPPVYYRIEETVSQEYKLSTIKCYCDNGYHSTGIFSYTGTAVYINPLGDTSLSCSQNIYCDFYNQKIITPVLIVPGIAGTEMEKESNLLWANVPKMILSPSDSFMDPLAFNQNITPSDSTVSISDVIKKKPSLDYTDGLINEFTSQGYIEGQTLFMFPYDWRYGVSGKYADGATNSDLLKQKIDEILQQTGAEKVDVVAHSLGGLIVKEYVIEHQTDSHIGKAIFVGVPNTGAPDAVKALIQGDNFGIGLGPVGLNDAEMKKIAQNMPTVYDLLPTQKYYNTTGSFVRLLDNTANSSYGVFSVSDQTVVSNFDYDQTKSFLVTDNSLNSQALTGAEGLHTEIFDNFDMRNAGVDLYSINGCKTGTMVKFEQAKYKNLFGQILTSYAPSKLNTGDGTVPVESSTNLPIDQDKKYYALTGEHSKLLSQDGSRQEIVNLISGSSLPVDSKLVTQEVNQCQLNGKAIIVYSPVDVSVTDQSGKEIKLIDGNTTNEIPNADFEIWGDHKLLYLPRDSGQAYTINMQGTGDGTYTIRAQDISDSLIVRTEIFDNLPATTELTGQININPGDNSTTLLVKPTSDSQPETILPTIVLPGDVTPSSPDQCKKKGWKNFGSLFNKQKECIDFFGTIHGKKK